MRVAILYCAGTVACFVMHGVHCLISEYQFVGWLLPRMYLSKFLQELVCIADPVQMRFAELSLDIPGPSRG